MKTKEEVKMMLVSELIEEINFLAHENKIRQLNEAELAYQKILRQRYIDLYKQNLRENLKSTTVLDQDGNDITPKK